MLNSTQQLDKGEDQLLSFSETMKILGISKPTLYKWINAMPPKIKCRAYEIGKKNYYGFSRAEVNKVKFKMKKKIGKGHSWL